MMKDLTFQDAARQAASVAEARQKEASDPAVSAFVSASAGTGKTKLLTDRLLRLMLSGAPPETIQCLTYTKAAAAEMKIRLSKRLGNWVIAEEAALDQALLALGFTPDEKIRHRARSLFGEITDLPRGIRIETIHAFCQALLKKFPLESGLSPHFSLIEDDEAERLRYEIQDALIAGLVRPADEAAFERLAPFLDEEKFNTLMQAFAEGEEDWVTLSDHLSEGYFWPEDFWQRLSERLKKRLGCRFSEEALLAREVCLIPHEAKLRTVLQYVAEKGHARNGRPVADKLLKFLAKSSEERQKNFSLYSDLWQTSAGKPRSAEGMLLKKAENYEESKERLTSESERVFFLKEQEKILTILQDTQALLRLILPAVGQYYLKKSRKGVLNFPDLIKKTGALLKDVGSAFVLYKLDCGTDHILLDEAQDTSPQQWSIIQKLSEDFFAGPAGQNPGRPDKTVFAVGDQKQSIYSFQGAGPAEFVNSRIMLEKRAVEGQRIWRNVGMNVSFRSTAPVLALTDAVFTKGSEAAEGVLNDEEISEHLAARKDFAGRVELWPLMQSLPEADEAEEPTETSDEAKEADEAEDNPVTADIFAKALALRIKKMIGGQEKLLSQDRPIRPGDILILLRNRVSGNLALRLMRALKAQNVPVTESDRLQLTAHLAVKDMLNLCDFLLLPADDFALACVLKSPLGGLSEESLMHLALERPGTLWQALQKKAPERPEWQAACTFLQTLLNKVDFISPFRLLADIFEAHGARARFLSRFGIEAKEPLDELLNQALLYGEKNIPSLQGFVDFLRSSKGDTKREMENIGDRVRIMTVHGAKGLEAPIVILPITPQRPSHSKTGVYRLTDEEGVLPVFVSSAGQMSKEVAAVKEKDAKAERLEANRLLYVALTRAADQAIICGYTGKKDTAGAPWYEMIKAGFEKLPGVKQEAFTDFPGTGGEKSVLVSAQRASFSDKKSGPALPTKPTKSRPVWLGQPPAWQAVLPHLPDKTLKIVIPSRPEGLEFGAVPAVCSPLQQTGKRLKGLQRGTLIHKLLQYLPDVQPEQREKAARAFLADFPEKGSDEAEKTELLKKIFTLLADKRLSTVFGPGSRAEVPVTGTVSGVAVSGVIDRAVFTAKEVFFIDYKTDRLPPSSEEAVPKAYLRQMAAYTAVLQDIFPQKKIRAALIFTEEAALTVLSEALLKKYVPTEELLLRSENISEKIL